MQKGCLLIHGLTGTPATVAILQESLLSAGFRVASPCLAGHGGTVDDLAASNWREWYDTVKASFAVLRKEVDHVYCAGISLGALLSIKLALDEGWGVRAMALMGTPLKLAFINRLAITLVRHSPLRAVIKGVAKDLKKSIADPEGQVRYGELSLPKLPTHAVFELSDLQRELTASIHRISNPILLLHGRHDKIAPPFNIDLVKRSVVSDIVESMLFERSRHVITMDYEKTDVAKAVVDFFGRFA